jgi:hypothetical protein
LSEGGSIGAKPAMVMLKEVLLCLGDDVDSAALKGWYLLKLCPNFGFARVRSEEIEHCDAANKKRLLSKEMQAEYVLIRRMYNGCVQKEDEREKRALQKLFGE